MEVTTAVNLSQKERVLSPKRKSNFAGELVMLNEGKPDLIPSNNRPVSAGKSASKRPSSGSLEVLKSDASIHSEIRKTKFQPTGTSAVKQEKQLKSTEQKEKQKCSCPGTKLCQYCVGVNEKMKELSVSGVCLNNQDIQSRSFMAPRAVPSTKSFTPSNTSAIGENSNAPNESESNSSEDDTDDDGDDQQGDGNREGFLSNGQTSAANKASLELLGQFLSALMKKDFSEAQNLCDQILEVEPTNPTCLEFRSTLKEKIQHDEEENSCSTDDDDDDDNEEEEDSDEDGDSRDDSSEDASAEDNDLSEDDKDDELAGIDVNKLNLFVGGVPVKKTSRS